jgi:pimeloyl-ACP methyl ester carboxylesterase
VVELPYVENDGVNIYYEVEGEGAPLVLLHGLTASLNSFRYAGYTEKLRKEHQLILVDARGNGRSDKPHQPEAYRLRLFVNDTVKVLDELGVEKTHFLGYSIGGMVGLGIGVYSPDRFKSLIIGGWGMRERDSEVSIKLDQMFIEKFLEGGIDSAFAARAESLKGLPSEVFSKRKEEFYLNDPEALLAFLSVREHVGFEEILPSLELPCLIYAGEQDFLYDMAKRTADLIPNAKFISLPGLDHMGAFSHSDRVLPHVQSFLETIT